MFRTLKHRLIRKKQRTQKVEHLFDFVKYKIRRVHGLYVPLLVGFMNTNIHTRSGPSAVKRRTFLSGTVGQCQRRSFSLPVVIPQALHALRMVTVNLSV